MKEIFITWIIFQLVIIGLASVTIHNQVVEKTYECHKHEKVKLWIGAVVPLYAFVQEPSIAVEYCTEKEDKNE